MSCNSLLHFSEKTEENNITVTHSQNSKNHTVLLATAIIRVRDNFGDLHTCRALLDSGSQSNFVTCELAKKLDLKFLKSNIQIKGINNSTSDSSFRVNIKISSQLNDFEKDIDCLVLKNVTSMLIHPYKGRCRKTLKSYICLFVCFTTRAIHIELVSELSSECFIAALKRFIARRGKPTDIYSDNGKNFIGSKTVLEEFRSFIRNDNTNREINSFFTNEFINWHTIPAYSPHMGGLWEAGIKSAKTHLKAVLNNHILTFEELYTLLTEIEACLNSRPLTELSSDPNDLMPLTPGHFLIGAPITAIPERNITNEKIGLVKRWNLIRYCSQQFWKRWSREYLSRLQTRNKWNRKKLNLSINDLYLLRGNICQF